MGVGFEVYGASGVLQADSQVQNFHMTQKGVAAFQAATYTTVDQPNSKQVSGPIVQAVFTAPAASPLLAIVCASPCIVMSTQATNGQWTFTVTSASAQAGSTLSWYIFDGMNAAGAQPNYGIQVFDANGALTFSTAIRPLKIVGGLSGSPGTSFTGDASRAYAFIQCQRGQDTNFVKYRDASSKDGGSTGGFTDSYIGAKCGSGTVQLIEETYCLANYAFQTSDSYENSYPVQMLIADVTGL